MLQFDIRGNITPSGLIPSNIAEMEHYFVKSIQSNTRLSNYQKYLAYSNDLKKIVGRHELRQWINGSFITRKKDPRDIDFITFIDHQTIIKLGKNLKNFYPEASWSIYGVDAYIVEEYPKESNLYKRYTLSDMSEWTFSFSQTRRNKRGQNFSKGFLEIYY